MLYVLLATLSSCFFTVTQAQNSTMHLFHSMQIKRADWDSCVYRNFGNDFKNVTKVFFYYYTGSSSGGNDHLYIKAWAMDNDYNAFELPIDNKVPSEVKTIPAPFFLSTLRFNKAELHSFMKIAVDSNWTSIKLVPFKYNKEGYFTDHMYLKATICNGNGQVGNKAVGSSMLAATQVVNPCPPCSK